MAKEKDVKVNLSPDQFSINEKGELVIREDEIVKTLQEQHAQAVPAQQAAARSNVSVSVTVTVRF